MYNGPRDTRPTPRKEPPKPRPKFKHANTFRALGRIFGKWKRGNSIRPITDGNICTICLAEYEKGQAVVQLKCGEHHCFHVKCIQTWSQTNRYCPLCGENFIEIAKDEDDREEKRKAELSRKSAPKMNESHSHLAESILVASISVEHNV